MKRTINCVLLASLLICPMAFAEELIEEVAPPPEGMEDNLDSITSVDNVAAVNIAEGEDAIVTGTMDGEITLFKVSNGWKIYSGALFVELVPNDADGQTGSIVADGDGYLYHLAGRPTLRCPPQSLANWYGPCKVNESSSG